MKATANAGLPLITILFLASFLPGGCAAPEIRSTEAHRKGLEPLTEEGYFAPKKPVARHYIGYAWSRQFGPVEDSVTADVRVKKERSLNNVLQERAFKRGISLGGESTLGQSGKLEVQGGGETASKLSGLEIVSAVSLADIPFEPNVPYITEALLLANFRIREEKEARAGIGADLTGARGAGRFSADTGGHGRALTEGEGLVVGYKVHMIDPGTYQQRDTGAIPLELDRSVDIPGAGLIVKARLHVIEPGAGKSLPRNLLWACPRADAVSRDMVAAWLVDIRSTDPGRNSLTVAFPAHPKVDDCLHYSGTIQSRIDPATDRIVRQRIRLTLVEAELDDAMNPKIFAARLSLLDESFNIRLVKPSELEARAK